MLIFMLCLLVTLIVGNYGGYQYAKHRLVDYKQRWIECNGTLQRVLAENQEQEELDTLPADNKWKLVYKLEKAYYTTGSRKGQSAGTQEFAYARRGKELRALDQTATMSDDQRKRHQKMIDRINKGELEI